MTPLADDPLAPDELAFGNFVHAVLQDFAGDRQLSQSTDAAKLAARLAGLVRAKFAACYGPRPSLAVQVALASAIQRLGRFAVLQTELAQEWEIVSTENRFVLTRGGCEIIARIDRIDRHRRDGRLRVMDYKTFDKIKTPAEMHFGACRQDTPAYAQVDITGDRGRIRRKAWQDLQLPLYREALLASGSYDADQIELGYFILPRAIGETGFQSWSDYSAALHDSAMTCADGVLAAMAAGVFWPPRDVPADWDDYAALFVGAPEQCFDLSGLPGRAGPPDPPPNGKAASELAASLSAYGARALPGPAGAFGRAGPPDPPRSCNQAASFLAAAGGACGARALPSRKKLPHGVCPWVSDGAVFFLTVNCRKRGENQLCLPDVAAVIRESIAFRQQAGDWWVHLLMLMPDHLHALIAFPREEDMRQVVFKWKEYAAKKIGVHWQRDFFDHRLRDDENYVEKAHYIRMNPVRRGLCQEITEWPYCWDDLQTTESGGSGGPACSARVLPNHASEAAP